MMTADHLHRASIAVRLKKRPDFLRAAAGRKNHTGLFTVQAASRADDPVAVARVGFTVTKKVGGAVERNRIKRRLREAVRLNPDLFMRPTHDYVIVARRVVLTAPFAMLTAGLTTAFRKLHEPSSPGRRRGPKAESRADVGTDGS